MSLLRTLPFLLLIVYFFVFMTSSPFTGYDDKRVVQSVIILVALILVVINRLNLAQTGNVAVIFLINAIGVISSLLSPKPFYGLIEVSVFVGLWAVIVVTASLQKSLANNRAIIYFSLMLLASTLVYLSSFFVGYLAAIVENHEREWWHLYRGFINIRFFNQYQIWTFPFLILIYIKTPQYLKKWKAGIGLLICLWWMLLFLSESRGAILAQVISILAVLVVYQKYALNYLKLYLSSASIGFLLYILLFLYLPHIILNADINSLRVMSLDSPGRLNLWLSALSLGAINPLTGIGPMHFAWYPNTHAHPHNFILQSYVEWGLIATLLFMWLLVRSLYKWVKVFNARTVQSYSSEVNYSAIALLAAFVSGVTYSLFSGVFVMPMSQLIMALVIGLMVGIYSEQSLAVIRCSTGVRKKKYLAMKVVFSCSFILLVTYILPESLSRFGVMNEPNLSSMKVIAPRFWQYGGIPDE